MGRSGSDSVQVEEFGLISASVSEGADNRARSGSVTVIDISDSLEALHGSWHEDERLVLSEDDAFEVPAAIWMERCFVCETEIILVLPSVILAKGSTNVGACRAEVEDPASVAVNDGKDINEIYDGG